MTHPFLKKYSLLALSCALALGAAAGVARAQTPLPAAERALLLDQHTSVVTSGYGLCWHSDFGPRPASSLECDPNYVATPLVVLAQATPQPIAVAAAPPPAALVLAAPISAPASERITLDADALFDFDQAVLRPAGREALDNFAAGLKDFGTETVTVTGHTDRFGSETYNQELSERRAETVRAYLAHAGVAAGRMVTEGKGEMQPATPDGQCAGAKSDQVIACLQPDRRVDVEVTGMRIAKAM